MPSLTKDLTLLISSNTEIVHFPVDLHVIKAVTVQKLTSDPAYNQAWTQIALLSGGITTDHIITLLSTGYCGILTPVYWTGSLPVESDHHIAAFIAGSAGDQFRLSASLWKMRLDEKGEFRADP